MKTYVYLLISVEGFHYVGQTPDLDRRLKEHNSGRSHATMHGHAWRIVYAEAYATRSEAMKLERSIKGAGVRRFLGCRLSR